MRRSLHEEGVMTKWLAAALLIASVGLGSAFAQGAVSETSSSPVRNSGPEAAAPQNTPSAPTDANRPSYGAKYAPSSGLGPDRGSNPSK